MKIKDEKTKILIAISEGDVSLLSPILQSKVPIILKKNEVCYTGTGNIQFWEDMAVRKNGGGYGDFCFCDINVSNPM